VHADPQAELDATIPLRAGGVLAEHLVHGERCPKGALRIVLVRDRRTEDDEDGVPDELLDRAVVRDGLLGEILEDPGDELLEDLRVQILRERREPDEISEEHRDQASLLAVLDGVAHALSVGQAARDHCRERNASALLAGPLASLPTGPV